MLVVDLVLIRGTTFISGILKKKNLTQDSL